MRGRRRSKGTSPRPTRPSVRLKPLEKYTAQLAEARAEAGVIREKANADGNAIVAAKKEQAQAEAERILHNAHAQIEADRQAAVVSPA